MYKQRKTVFENGQAVQKEWIVDIGALQSIKDNDWIEEFPILVKTDLEQMAKAFPHWFLVAGYQSNPLVCPDDEEYIVPKNGSLSCIKCNKEFPNNGRIQALIWIGMIPVPIQGKEKTKRNILKLRNQGRLKLPFIEKSEHLLVPIKIVYPSSWNESDPKSYYDYNNIFYETIGLRDSGTSHERHMVGNAQMCLFSRWHKMSIRDVIQNRIIPHAIAQVKIANGERPQKWFN